jgi:hypothetical protein
MENSSLYPQYITSPTESRIKASARRQEASQQTFTNNQSRLRFKPDAATTAPVVSLCSDHYSRRDSHPQATICSRYFVVGPVLSPTTSKLFPNDTSPNLKLATLSQLAIHGNLEFASTVLVADPVMRRSFSPVVRSLGDVVAILETER